MGVPSSAVNVHGSVSLMRVQVPVRIIPPEWITTRPVPTVTGTFERPSAGLAGRFEDGDRDAGRDELDGTGKPGPAGADDRDATEAAHVLSPRGPRS